MFNAVFVFLQALLVVNFFISALSLNKRNHFFLLFGISLLFMLPVQGITIPIYSRGIFSDLSVTSLFLLSAVFCRHFTSRPLLSRQSFTLIMLVAALLGVWLYPISLFANIRFSLYAWGYSPVLLASVLFFCAALAWFSKRQAVAVLIVCVFFAYNFNLLQASNLWNYLLDPLLVFFAWGWLCFVGFRKLSPTYALIPINREK